MMEQALPVFFFFVMGLAMFIYVVLDGYDLGIGLLLPLADDAEKDVMISSIGPFWDANETWIVLGVGVLLIAFPLAHGPILSALYIPVTVMLIGLILRGVAFDFRVKAGDQHKSMWNGFFFLGSLLATLSQGWMVGAYLTGMEKIPSAYLLSVIIALTMPAFYILLGAAWLLIKTEGDLYQKALRWARKVLPVMALGLLVLSITTPLVSSTIAAKWFTVQNFIGLLPIPVTTALTLFLVATLLYRPQLLANGHEWWLMMCVVVICFMVMLGLAYSLYPFIIIEHMTLWEAAAYVESLKVIAVGVAITLPCILGYTIFTYYIFRGKSAALSYGG